MFGDSVGAGLAKIKDEIGWTTSHEDLKFNSLLIMPFLEDSPENTPSVFFVIDVLLVVNDSG